MGCLSVLSISSFRLPYPPRGETGLEIESISHTGSLCSVKQKSFDVLTALSISVYVCLCVSMCSIALFSIALFRIEIDCVRYFLKGAQATSRRNPVTSPVTLRSECNHSEPHVKSAALTGSDTVSRLGVYVDQGSLSSDSLT